MTKVNLNYGNETKSDIFPWDIFKSDSISILKYFNDFQNQNFSILWLKRSQTIGKKQNQTSFHETYLNLTAYLFFLSIYIKAFQWLSKSRVLSFMTKVNRNNGNETKSDIFQWNIFKSNVIFHWSQNTKIFQWLL